MLTVDLLRRSRQAWPDAAAVEWEGGSWTYGQLYRRAAGVARGLRSLGVRPGEFVAALLPNTPEYFPIYFGIQAAGSVLVAVNPLFREEEIAHILRDSAAAAIFVPERLYPRVAALAGRLPPTLRHVVLLGREVPDTVPYAELLTAGEEFPDPGVDEGAVAACLYTSGTTGAPKGALLTHANLTFDVAAILQVVPLTERDCFLGVLPYFHSFAQMGNLLLPVAVGARTVVLEAFRPEAVVSAMTGSGVTVFAAVPAMFAALAAAGQKLPTLRLCISGGAPLPPTVAAAFRRSCGLELLEGDGPTETSPVAYVTPPAGPVKPGSVGPPLPGVAVRILDEAGRELHRGQVGEVAVHGPNVMRGYLNRPEETAEALRDGWLRTGDLGYLDEDGYVFLVDRKKDLILSGGMNVYPREVEEVLLTHPAVAQAAVVGRMHPLRGETVRAVVVLRLGQTATAGELGAFCRQHLAAFKCPREVEFREELPLLPTGKVDKKALRQS